MLSNPICAVKSVTAIHAKISKHHSDSNVATQRFSFTERRAFWEAFDRKCAYCGNPIGFLYEMEIDHVINEALSNRPDELDTVLREHKLPAEFDLCGRLNLVSSCKRCNSKKGGNRLPALISFGLEAARKKYNAIEELVQKFKADKKVDTLLAEVGSAVETGRTTREYVAAALGIDTAVVKTRAIQAESEVLRIFGNASAGLMTWPRTTEGKWLDRPEVNTILRKFDSQSSFNVLLGAAGSGKSALLAHLAQRLYDQGVALLALKADLLPPELESPRELDEYLGTPGPLVEGLAQLAESETVVLLIDQLDAVSDLMIQKTSRLTVLLSLINRVRGIENLHILLSCRTFEFKHDLRLMTLNPDAVTLEDPPFDAVEGILRAADLDWEKWPADGKELLRRPQHLNFFLQHFRAHGLPPVHSYHAMLESVLTTRISDIGGQAAAHVLERVAATMVQDENLWPPVSSFDLEARTYIDRFADVDLLAFSSDRLRIGFRHQTIFDFIAARSFASGAASLSQYVLDRQNSLFVRPILWRALRYLHDADQRAYRDQLRILWATTDLRLHIRLLIIEFLGQAKEPLDFEIEMIRPALHDPDLREPIVRSIQGSPSWFAQILGDLPIMMVRDNVSAHLAVRLLRPALSFRADVVLSLIERCWLPDTTRDALTIHALQELNAWDDHAIQIAEIVYRRNPPHAAFSGHLERVVAQSRPDLASRLVAAELSFILERAETESQSIPSPPEDAPEVDQIVFLLTKGNESRDVVRKFIRHESRWHGIAKVAQAAPESFIAHVWPWVLRVANLFSDRRTLRRTSYFEDYTFDNAHHYHEDLTSGIDAAITGFAEEQPLAFIQFARVHHSSDLLSIHRWLTMGYCRLGRVKPAECIEYLLGDSRRFALGPSQDQHQETCRLIQASTPFAEPASVRALEREIRRWVYYPSTPDDDVKSRFDRMKWSREHRLRLLRSIPADVISEEAAKLLEEEERALPETPNRDWGLTEFEKIGSPIGHKKMALASREDLLRLFDELHDGTGWQHPHDWMKGGVVQASRAFGELAKEDPDLATSIIQDLQPTRHEHYVSEAIRILGESSRCHPVELIKNIHLLSSKGFTSEVFRHGAASAFSKVAEKLNGLPDDTCEMLESWLDDWKETPGDQLDDGSNGELKPDENVRSVLWDDRGGVLPWGNYPVLEALFLGYLLRKPRDTTSWLSVLERHAQRFENPQVWKALANHQMRFFGPTEYQRAATLLKDVLSRPEVLHSEEVARLVARLHGWLPASLTHSCLSQWQTGSWPQGPQAAAEVAMLRHALVPTDTYCSEFVDRILAGTAGNGEQLARMKLGITFASAEVWNVAKARSEATRVLSSVLPCTDEHMVFAWRRVFNSPWECVDDCSRQILDALLANREILRTPHINPLIDRLKDLVGSGLEPQRVCLVVSAVVEECGNEIGDFRTAWPTIAEDLIHIALTLQRLSSTERCGVQIFERLMASNAYKIVEVLSDLDRKWPS